MCDHPHNHIGQTAPIVLAVFIALAALLGASIWFLIYALATALADGHFPQVAASCSSATGLVSLILLTRMVIAPKEEP